MKTGLLIAGEYSVAEAVSLAALAEAEGFASAWYADERFYHEPYGPLALFAQQTKRIALGPCVTDPYTRHPALTALAIATLDEISGGRAVLGFGAGKSGLPEMGLDREKAAQSIREGVQLIRRLLSGETVSFSGHTVAFHDGKLNLAARPSLPILVATTPNSPLTATVAGEVADGAILANGAAPETIKPALEKIEAGLARGGRSRRDFSLVLRLDCSIAEDGTAARDAVRGVITRLLYRYRDRLDEYLAPYGVDVSKSWAEKLRATVYQGHSRQPGALDGLAAELPDEALQPFCLAGTPDEVLAQALMLKDHGADQIMIQPRPLQADAAAGVARRWARDILPKLN